MKRRLPDFLRLFTEHMPKKTAIGAVVLSSML
jgi:hypothetical protein